MSDEQLFAAAVRFQRREHGATQRALASWVGVDFTYISKVENGHERPSRNLVVRMDGALSADGFLMAMFDALPCPHCGRSG